MFKEGNLVYYKNKCALVIEGGEKSEIKTKDGTKVKIREKDALLLHPGPVKNFSFEEQLSGDFETAREMLGNDTVNIETLSDLVYGVFTPQSVWNCLALLQEGLLFTGSPDAIKAVSNSEREEKERKQKEKDSLEGLRNDFIARAKKYELKEGDERFLAELEAFAEGRTDKARMAKDLGLEESPEAVHSYLLKSGHWKPLHNPYPLRYGLSLKASDLSLDEPLALTRRDLRHLDAYAIDNKWSHDPDDAISYDGKILYVHIADPAERVHPLSKLDVDALGRSATFYNPQGIVPMLPAAALDEFGLGLSGESKALTFAIELEDNGNIKAVELYPSLVKVKRETYEGVDEKLKQEPFASFDRIAKILEEKRVKNGAVSIELPEVHLSIKDEHVEIVSVKSTRSSAIVREMMLIAGESCAKWAFLNAIPFPFYSQEAPLDAANIPDGLAGEIAKRKLMRPGLVSSAPSAHMGLGLGMYTQVTSPLRRYADLLAHEQIHAYLLGAPLQNSDSMIEKIGAVQAAAGRIRRAERESLQHLTIVYLLEHPEAEYDAIVVGQGKLTSLYIPALAFETRAAIPHKTELNETVRVRFTGADLARLEARFSCDS